MSISTKLLNNVRSSFDNQAAQFIILDLGYPMAKATLKNVIYSLRHVINLAAHMNSKSRIPAFGMATIDLSYTKLYRVSSIKGNLSAILESFDLLSKMTANGAKTTVDNYSNLLFEAVKDVMTDFIVKSEAVKSEKKLWQSWPSQVQVTLVTGKKASPVAEIFWDIVDSNKNVSFKLKQIDIVEIEPEDGFDLVNAVIHKDGFINVVVQSDSYASLDSIFKEWLLESSSFSEHLRIILNEELNLVIRCDMNDVIIKSDTLPFGHRFKLKNDQNSNLIPASTSIEGPNDVCIYELKVIKRVKSSVCQSHLFGAAQRLTPTQSWKLSLTESFVIKELFQTLCKELQESGEGLLAECKYEENSTNAMTTYFFITIDAGNLLLNSISPLELELPSHSETSDIKISQEAKTLIQQSLEKIPIIEKYSPRDFQSNLYECIEKKNIKQTPPKLRTPLKRASSPYKIQLRSKTLKSDDTKESQKDVSLDKPGEYVPQFAPKIIKRKKIVRKSLSQKEKEPLKQVLHPALLPQNLKKKFRSKNFSKELDELDLDLGEAEFLM